MFFSYLSIVSGESKIHPENGSRRHNSSQGGDLRVATMTILGFNGI